MSSYCQGTKKHVNKNLTNCTCSSRKRELKILNLLVEQDQDYVQKDLVAKLKESRTTIWKTLKGLEKKGFIASTKRGSCKNYEITDQGEYYYRDQYVNPLHRGMKTWIRIHDVRIKGEIVGDLPTNRMREWKVFMTKSWKGRTRKFTHDDSVVTVNLTPRSAILYFSILSAPTLAEAETRLGDAVGWIIKKLSQEEIYVTNLHQNTESSYAFIYDPISEYFYRHKITYDGSSFSIDHSHDVPEVEFHGKEAAKKYVSFLEGVETGQYSRDMNEIRESIEDLRIESRKRINRCLIRIGELELKFEKSSKEVTLIETHLRRRDFNS